MKVESVGSDETTPYIDNSATEIASSSSTSTILWNEHNFVERTQLRISEWEWRAPAQKHGQISLVNADKETWNKHISCVDDRKVYFHYQNRRFRFIFLQMRCQEFDQEQNCYLSLCWKEKSAILIRKSTVEDSPQVFKPLTCLYVNPSWSKWEKTQFYLTFAGRESHQFMRNGDFWRKSSRRHKKQKQPSLLAS